MIAPAELSTADIARLRGVSYQAAYKWLRALEEKYGPTVVGRNGRRLYTSHEALAKVSPGLSREHLYAPRIAELETAQAEQSKRIDKLVSDVLHLSNEITKFHEMANAWFRKGGE